MAIALCAKKVRFCAKNEISYSPGFEIEAHQ